MEATSAPARGDEPRSLPGTGLNRWLQIFLTIIAGAAVAVITWTVIARFLHIIILLIASLLLAYLLGPIVDRLQTRLPRALAILLVYIALLAALTVGVVLFLGPLISQLQGVVNAIPQLITDQAGLPSQIDRFFKDQGIPLQVATLQQQVLGYLSGASTGLLGGTLAFLASVVTVVTDVFLVLAIGFYLLLDGANIRNAMLRLLPNRPRERWFFLEATLNTVVGGYIRGQLLVAATVGVAAGLGCAVLGVHYPLVIGLLAFLFEFIPLIGPVLGMVPALLIAAFQPLPLVVWVIVYFIALQQVESNLIVPRISGHAVGLHPLGAMLALLAGVELGGLGGALLAVPLAGVIYVLALALYTDATHQTELLMAPQRPAPYVSLRQVLRRRRGAAPRPAPAVPPAAPGGERLANLAEQQAVLMAAYAQDQADAGAPSAPAPVLAPAGPEGAAPGDSA